ncbi:hypothetical protein [Sandarakinorhabdus rubra]|uniref:hypothetical protein n=1 Tax=Sandarakinorhabdus rubra TaxID=2672568 RepID=UPI0013D961BF|nr:hypothetical protein [Sandarakinorhabdus rubra]
MRRHAIFLIPLSALLLGGCGVEQSQPAPVTDGERWGHLPPDPERPQQADAETPPNA